MPTQAQIQQVLVAQIDHDDLRFRLSPLPPATTAEDNPELAAAIARVGLLQPPILLPGGNHGMVVVSGHSRLRLVAAILGLTALPCLVLPSECDEATALGVALEALCARRRPSPMEAAFFCRRMLSHLDAATIATCYLPLLGLAPTPFLVSQTARLAELEEPFAVAIHQGRLHEAVGRELLALPLAERLALFELIDLLQLSVGNQKKLVATCRELAGRDRLSLRSILGGAEIREILDHPAMNVPQKAAALMRLLTTRRFPRLTAAQTEFDHFRQGLRLPPNVQLEPATSFEDESVRLLITLPDRQTLAANWPALRKALEAREYPATSRQP